MGICRWGCVDQSNYPGMFIHIIDRGDARFLAYRSHSSVMRVADTMSPLELYFKKVEISTLKLLKFKGH